MKNIYLGNDTLISLTSLKNSNLDSYLNDVTVEIDITDVSGVTIDSNTFPASMTYATGSDGDYYYSVQSSLPFVEGQIYIAKIAVNSSGVDAAWEFKLLAIKRMVE